MTVKTGKFKRFVRALTLALGVTLTACACKPPSPEQQMSVRYSATPFGVELKRFFDEAGVIDKDKFDELNRLLVNAEKGCGFCVTALIADDIGEDKSDGAVKDYIYRYYEEKFKADDNGAILLINLDTGYHYILMSGVCLDVFTEEQVENMLAAVREKADAADYGGAVTGFCETVTAIAAPEETADGEKEENNGA